MGATAPASTREALDMVRAGLGYLATADAAQLPAAVQAEHRSALLSGRPPDGCPRHHCKLDAADQPDLRSRHDKLPNAQRHADRRISRGGHDQRSSRCATDDPGHGRPADSARLTAGLAARGGIHIIQIGIHVVRHRRGPKAGRLLGALIGVSGFTSRGSWRGEGTGFVSSPVDARPSASAGRGGHLG